MVISSTANQKIKDIRKLKDSRELKKSDLYYLEGLRIIGEALEHNAPIETIISCPELIKNEFGFQMLQKAQAHGLEILEVSQQVFNSIAIKDNPQGIAAVARKTVFSLSDLSAESGTLVVLTEIADPGNLGTIIRTADAVSANGIILIGNCASQYDASAVRGSMGAIFSQKIVRTGLAEFLDWQKMLGIQMVGTSDHTQLDYMEADYQNPLILLMGSEREGLSAELESACDLMVRIPMLRSSDSLNLAVATGIMLYQIYNCQRGYAFRKGRS